MANPKDNETAKTQAAAAAQPQSTSADQAELARLRAETDNLRNQLAQRDAAERNNPGLPHGPVATRALGGQAPEKVTLSIAHAGPPGSGIQVVHDANQTPVPLAQGEVRDDVEFDAVTAKLLRERSEQGIGHIVVKGSEPDRRREREQPTRQDIEKKEQENLRTGKEQERVRLKERPERIGTGAGLPPDRNPVTGEVNTGETRQR